MIIENQKCKHQCTILSEYKIENVFTTFYERYNITIHEIIHHKKFNICQIQILDNSPIFTYLKPIVIFLNIKSDIGYINNTRLFFGASTWATRVYGDIQRPPFCLTISFCDTWKLPQTLHRSLSCSSGTFSELGAELWINPLRVHFQLFTSDNDILESWITQLKQLQVPSTFFQNWILAIAKKSRFLG